MDTPEDSVRRLQEVVVRDRTSPHAARIDSTGSVSLSAAAMRHGPRALGEADALHTLTSLPGYTAAGDYGSGVSVGSDDLSTTLYTIDGATVFHPFHFGGIFSGFNSSHLASVRVDRIHRCPSSPPRTGALIEALTSDYIPSSTAGIVNIGMLATSATLAIPVSPRTAIRLSGRLSHINTIYGRILDSDDTSMRYGFEEANLTMLHQFDSCNSLKISAYANHDRLLYGDNGFDMDTHLTWSNLAASVSWRHQGAGVEWHQDMAYSQYTSDLTTSMASVLFNLNSGVRQLAAYADATFPDLDAMLGYRAEFTRFEPMRPKITGAPGAESVISAINAMIAGVAGEKTWRTGTLQVSAGASAFLSHADGSTHFALDPALTLSGTVRGSWSVKVSQATQFTHQVGLSDIGFASDFYLPSARAIPPQRTLGIDFVYRSMPFHNIDITFNAFAKRVLHSPQYRGSVLGLIDDTYDPFDAVTLTNGYNTGGDVMLSLSAGPMSVMAGYGLAVCRRKVADRWTSSANEPLHSLKLAADGALSPALRLSAFFTLSSGRPYTPIEAIYIIGGNVVTEYGLLNSSRLPAYHRLDLSGTYTFPAIRTRGHHYLHHYANLSVTNAYGHRNVEMQYFTYRETDHTVYLRRIGSIYRFLPSISYTVEF